MLPTSFTQDSLGTGKYSQSQAWLMHDSVKPNTTSAPISSPIPQTYRVPESLVPLMDSVSPPQEGGANESNLAHGIQIYTFIPFLAHLAFTIGITAFAFAYIDSRDFHINSRYPTAIEPDGSTSHPADFAPLQSDITTALSFGATLTRVMGAWWSVGIVWRCLFHLMEQGGLSMDGAARLLGIWFPIPWPSNAGRRSSLAVVYIVILATSVLGYSSPLIAGSITWNQSFLLVRGSKLINFIPSRFNFTLLPDTPGFPGLTLEDVIAEITNLARNSAEQDAQLAWGDKRRPSTVMTRVLRDNRQFPLSGYPINSTLQSVRLPYISIDAFEVIKDPYSTLTPKQKALLRANHTGNPFFPTTQGALAVFPISGTVALIPDEQWGDWGVGFWTSPTTTIAETRILGILSEVGLHKGNPHFNCSPSTPILGEIPPEAGIYLDDGFGFGFCYIFATVTYRAGAADCERCPIPLPNVVQNDAALLFQPDRMTLPALALAPRLGSDLTHDNYSIPYSFSNFENYATGVLSRSYQIAWSTLNNEYGENVETDIMIPVPALRASIEKWRVYTWLGLNMIALLSGLFFVFMQRYYYKRPWLERPQMSGLLLDIRDVLQDDGWVVLQDGWDGDAWNRQRKYPPGLLVLRHGATRHRSVTLSKGEAVGVRMIR